VERLWKETIVFILTKYPSISIEEESEEKEARTQLGELGKISPMKQQFVITHNSSNRYCHINRHLSYKHAFCQNVVSTKNCVSLYFCKNIRCLSVGLLRISQVFSVSCKINISGLRQTAGS
jgi:hypothetical protein